MSVSLLLGGHIVSLKVSWTSSSSEVGIYPYIQSYTNKVMIMMHTARNKAMETACISFSSLRNMIGERQNPKKMLQNSFLMVNRPNQFEVAEIEKMSVVNEAIVFPTRMNITIQIPKDVRKITVDIKKTLFLPKTK